MSLCPSCSKPIPEGRVLVCGECWTLVPRWDQIGFRRLYEAHRSSPGRWKSKADKIVRELRAKKQGILTQ